MLGGHRLLWQRGVWAVQQIWGSIFIQRKMGVLTLLHCALSHSMFIIADRQMQKNNSEFESSLFGILQC